MFKDKIEPIRTNGMETIGGKYLIPTVIVTVFWYYTGDEGQLQTKKLNILPYFTDSPVNILSANSLDEFIKDK